MCHIVMGKTHTASPQQQGEAHRPYGEVHHHQGEGPYYHGEGPRQYGVYPRFLTKIPSPPQKPLPHIINRCRTGTALHPHPPEQKSGRCQMTAAIRGPTLDQGHTVKIEWLCHMKRTIMEITFGCGECESLRVRQLRGKEY